jgi:hypothetical protein
VPRGKQVLRINLDETSIAYVPDTIKGLVVSRRRWGAHGNRRPVVKSKRIRGACTFIARLWRTCRCVVRELLCTQGGHVGLVGQLGGHAC